MSQLSIELQGSTQAAEVVVNPHPRRRWTLTRSDWIAQTTFAIGRALGRDETSQALRGATDREIERLTAAQNRLTAEAVRWDLIGSANTGRRHRI